MVAKYLHDNNTSNNTDSNNNGHSHHTNFSITKICTKRPPNKKESNKQPPQKKDKTVPKLKQETTHTISTCKGPSFNKNYYSTKNLPLLKASVNFKMF